MRLLIQALFTSTFLFALASNAMGSISNFWAIYHLEHPKGQRDEQEIEEAAVDVLWSILNNLEAQMSLRALTKYKYFDLAQEAAARVLDTIESNYDARSSLEELTKYGYFHLAQEAAAGVLDTVKSNYDAILSLVMLTKYGYFDLARKCKAKFFKTDHSSPENIDGVQEATPLQQKLLKGLIGYPPTHDRTQQDLLKGHMWPFLGITMRDPHISSWEKRPY